MKWIRRLLCPAVKHELFLCYPPEHANMVSNLLDDLKQINLVETYEIAGETEGNVNFAIEFTEPRGMYVFGNIIAYRQMFPTQRTLQDYFNMVTSRN